MINGGTAPFTYSWNTGQTTATATGLIAGMYNVMVTDANGCSSTCSATIGQPATAVTAMCSKTDVSCFGGNDGQVSVMASGGASPYSYLWNTGFGPSSGGSTNPVVSGLPVGTYSVTVTDGNGCKNICTVQVNQPALLTSTCSKTDVSCFGGNDGTATAMTNDGTAPYSYSWNNGQTTATATGLIAGMYNVMVTDANGCIANCNVTVGEPAVSITCPNNLILACDDSNLMTQVNSWLLTGASFDPCLMNVTVTTDYNASNFMGCGNSGSQVVNFSLRNNMLQEIATCQATLTINPPPPATLICPMIPDLDITDVATFMPPPINYTGACSNSGSINGVISSTNFDACGGTITITYAGVDQCGNAVATNCNVNVNAAPAPTIDLTGVPISMTCAFFETAGLGGPNAPTVTFSNGLVGLGAINSGPIAPNGTLSIISANCTRTIQYLYSYTDPCGRTITGNTDFIPIDPPPAPTLTLPAIPLNISCDDAINFMAGDATYTNMGVGPCAVNGTITPILTPNWDKCNGGTITVDYNAIAQANGFNNCNYPVSGSVVVNVDPAPPAIVTVPTIPATMTCDASGAFTIPVATFTNGLMNACGNNGTLQPTVTGMYNPCTGTTFTVNWSGPDECGNMLTAGPVDYFVEPAPAPTLTVPTLPTQLTCDDADAFMAADATYNNNAVAAFCQISGTLSATITPNWDKCNGGTITVRYVGNSTACNHPLDSGPIVIPVSAAPAPMITMPNLPASLSCADAATYVASNATFTNGEDGNCEISGFIFPSQTNSFSACGGKITVSYMITTSGADCSYLLQSGTHEIMVDPAPAATVTAPPMPTSITCIQADNFSIPSASFTNGIIGDCNISGTIPPTIDNSGWTKCGGILKVTYITTDLCNNVLTSGPFDITVTPAPEATATPPPAFATNISCVSATGFIAPPVNYDNGITGTCNISGTIQPSITNNFDNCGGNITITYATTDMCGRAISLPAYVIAVDPAPEATVTVLPVPTSISCEMATTYMAQDATYNNGLTGTCAISGSFSPTVNSDFDKCGGTIMLTYISQDMCNRALDGGTFTITVEPAPEATVTVPSVPTSISCEMATTYMAQDATYNNGLTGTCGISGSFSLTVNTNFDKCGGTIMLTYISQDMCNRALDGGTFSITVEPAPEATVTVPSVPTSISCEMATTYMAQDATYNNGLTGTCEIAGNIAGTVTPSFDKCGGTITLNWSGQDMCGRPLTAGPVVITVDPAPEATIMQPNIPTNLSCENAVGYMAPDAPYSNGLTGTCAIAGTVTGVVTPNFDKCGGDISITYNGVDECGRTIIAATFMITVDPAPAATIMQPNIPTTLSCADADGYNPPTAPYSNGLTGTCAIAGTVTGVVTPNFDECGGNISITYNGLDECGRTIIAASFTITVDPAPQATVSVPFVPSSVSCVDATTYAAPTANYNNGLTGVCEISGTINPSVTPNFDACGGTITITYNSQDDCGRTLTAARTITVQPAPTATITLPTFPTNITCEASQNFLEEYASYDNGLTGVCNVSGFIQPVVTKVVDACEGGYISLTYNGFDQCGRALSTPTVFINVEPAPIAVLTLPETPQTLNCWEVEGYTPGPATYTNGMNGTCENSGFIYPILTQLWDNKCEGGFIIISYDGYDDCGNHLSYPAFKISILPDAIAPIGTCEGVEESLQFMDEIPEPDELGDYKYQIASNYSDYCSSVVITVVGDTGEPVCGLDGTFQRVYDMEVADECGNVADTCQVIFSGNCNPEYCTLSQKFYSGETKIDSLFGYSSLEILDSLMGYGEDSIHIGSGECAFILDDAQCIQNIISGTGTSYPLNVGYDLNCDEKLNNVLVNQIITTTLNVRYNNLFNDSLDFGNYQLSAICQNIAPYILDTLPTNPTVNNLLDYANDFLACQCEGTCGDFGNFINSELSGIFLALNSRFNNCHVPGPCTIADDCYVINNGNLIGLDAKNKGYKAKIDWVMLTDLDIDRYELERSADGIDFTNLGEIIAEQSDEARSYDFTDDTPLEGTNFYRLKVFHVDGGFCYTDNRQVDIELPYTQVNLFPNPTNHRINLSVHGFVGKAGQVTIGNNQGVVIKTQSYDAIPQNVLQFDVQDYVSGMYWITIKVEGHKSVTKKFIVSKLDFQEVRN